MCALAGSNWATAQNPNSEPRQVPSGKLSSQLGKPAATQDNEAVDGIAAVVNSDIITKSELNRQVALIERQMQRKGTPLPDRRALQEQILNRMVMDRAQLQLAKETGIRVEDNQIESTMARVAEQNKLPLEQFLQKLQAEGVSPSRFREEVRSEMILNRLREREVESRIQVSDAEVQAYLSSRTQGAVGNKPEVNWVQLLVKLPANASTKTQETAKERAKKLEDALKGNTSIEDILKSNPDLVIEGTGAMGWQGFDNVPTLFGNFLGNGQVNATQTIQSPNGLHVLKILGKRQGGMELDATPIEQTKVSHILIRLSPEITEDEAKRRLNSVQEQLTAGKAEFATLAKRYSQDGSAANGGDLGWLYPGDTVPEFEREMERLAPGEISPVFQSRFGFHIVKVDARRQKAASEERQRQNAKQAIRASKSEENYQEWLRQLKDRTFIDIRL